MPHQYQKARGEVLPPRLDCHDTARACSQHAVRLTQALYDQSDAPSDSEDFFQIDVDRKRVVETVSFLWDFFSKPCFAFFSAFSCPENEAR